MRSIIKNLILLFTIYYLLISNVFAAEIPQDLKNAINDKTQALQEVNKKILETQEKLDEAEGKSKTLQGEIKQFEYQLKQLDLGIRSSEITIEKLNLEIKSLEYDIGDARAKIDVKKAGIAKILRIVQAKDDETTLVILLKNNTVAESMDELQNLASLNSGLSSEIGELYKLNAELSKSLDLTSEKKSETELESRNLKNRKIIAGTQKEEKNKLLARTKSQEKEYQKLIGNLEKEQAAIAAEIEKMEEELRLKIDPSLLPTPRPGVLAFPVENPRITQEYGRTKFAIYGYKGQWHNGLDFGAPIGTPVFAAEKGTVLEVWDQDKYCYRGAYGKFIVIEHENNLTTLYAHLSLATAEKGQKVERGQLIGYVGKTGYATGPHLHFTVYASPTFRIGPSKLNCGPVMPYGGDLNPEQYL